jgi:radical SAM protein with 4Fe4S-binding SPASM domain
MPLSDELLSQLVTSGLDYIIVGIDGVTQETYERYRVRGDLERVLSNLRRLIEMKRAHGSKTPVIEWQMIDFDFNRQEQASAEALSRALGVDRFCLKADCYSDHSPDDPQGAEESAYRRRKSCPLLWTSLAIECDGSVSACLSRDDDSLYMGSLNESTLAEIWDSEEYTELRRTHAQPEDPTRYLCRRCSLFEGRGHLRQPSD